MFGAAIGFVTVLNIIGAGLAFVVNVWAALQTSGRLRLMFQSIATLGLIYAAGYGWLLFNPDRVEQWSDVLRPVSILAWIVAWALEPVVIVHDHKRRAAQITQETKRVIDEVGL